MSQQDEEIVVVCAADERYAAPLAAMVVSLLAHIAPTQAIALYVVDGGLSPWQRHRLLDSWKHELLGVHWVTVDEDRLVGLPYWKRFGVTAYYRLFMPEFLPSEVTKAIWLDADLLVLHDPARLWWTNVAGAALAAVQDMVVPTVASPLGISAYEQLGLDPQCSYFNSGVLVVNLEWWRENRVGEQVLSYVDRYARSIIFPDQEGLNVVAQNAWLPLDPRWNVIASVRGRRFYRPRHLEPAAYASVAADPWVLHFAGSWKPWTYHNSSSDLAYFYRYLDETAWSNWRAPRTAKSLALGFYDAYLRSALYPIEQRAFALRERGAMRRRGSA